MLYEDYLRHAGNMKKKLHDHIYRMNLPDIIGHNILFKPLGRERL